MALRCRYRVSGGDAGQPSEDSVTTCFLLGRRRPESRPITENAAGRVTGIDIDELVTMVSGTDYGVSIRTVGEVDVTSMVDNMPGDTKSLTFPSPLAMDKDVQPGDLMAFGVHGSETLDGIIVSVEPRGDISATVTLMPFSSGIYTSDTMAIPAYNTGLTPLAGRDALVIVSVRSDESLIRLDGTELGPGDPWWKCDRWDRKTHGLSARFARPGTMENYQPADVRFQTSDFIEIGGVIQGQDYDLRLRWTSPTGLLSGTMD